MKINKTYAYAIAGVLILLLALFLSVGKFPSSQVVNDPAWLSNSIDQSQRLRLLLDATNEYTAFAREHKAGVCWNEEYFVTHQSECTCDPFLYGHEPTTEEKMADAGKNCIQNMLAGSSYFASKKDLWLAGIEFPANFNDSLVNFQVDQAQSSFNKWVEYQGRQHGWSQEVLKGLTQGFSNSN